MRLVLERGPVKTFQSFGHSGLWPGSHRTPVSAGANSWSSSIQICEESALVVSRSCRVTVAYDHGLICHVRQPSPQIASNQAQERLRHKLNPVSALQAVAVQWEVSGGHQGIKGNATCR